MDARLVRAVVLTAVLASLGAGYRTPNFVVEASNEGLAQRVGLAAEKFRRELAVDWLGKEMPDWAEPCPITVQVAPHLGAGGETSFVFDRGHVFGWKMRVQGTEERVLDSVLPHEVTHTVLATHFRRPLPRWADEGACTTVEHSSERTKQQNMLVTFLRTNKGIAFSRMFAMKEYPPDMLPLYAQGYSLARYLIEQGGRRKFLAYVAEGLKRENWSGATKTYYGYTGLAQLQNSWLDWVKQGSPSLDNSPASPNQLIASRTNQSGASKSPQASVPLAQARFQSDDPTGGERGRVRPAAATRAAGREPADDVDRAGRAAGVSTFEPDQRQWNARDQLREESLALAQAAQGEGSREVRSNKRSVYDRGFEPSGNAHQYPFTASTNPTPDQQSGDGGARPHPGDSKPAEYSAAASNDTTAHDRNRRRVILEWSRDGSHDRPTGEPLVDASW